MIFIQSISYEGGAVENSTENCSGELQKTGRICFKRFAFLVEQKVHFVRDKYFCDKKHFM